MTDLLKGKVAIVTGSGRGIGRAVALQMAQEGAKVVINDYGVMTDGTGASTSPAEQVVREIQSMGGAAVANTESVADFAGGKHIIETAVKEFGRIDILVNNAGIIRDRIIFNLSDEDWDMVLKVHLYGHFSCTRAAAAVMKEQRWGRIVNISSTAGLGQTMGSSNYAAAKEGIIGFTRAVAKDMERYHVTCNAIRPLAITRNFDDKRREAWLRQGKTETVEIMDKSKPENIAAFCCFLASEEAAGITGRTFFVGGGEVSLYSEPEKIKTVRRESIWTVDELRAQIPSCMFSA